MAYGNKQIFRGTSTTAATGPDQVGGVFTFTRFPFGSFLVGARASLPQDSAGNYRVHLSKGDPAVDGDAQDLVLSYGLDADYLGYFDLDEAVSVGQYAVAQSYSALRHPVETAGTLYAVIEALEGAVPVAGDLALTLVAETD